MILQACLAHPHNLHIFLNLTTPRNAVASSSLSLLAVVSFFYCTSATALSNCQWHSYYPSTPNIPKSLQDGTYIVNSKTNDNLILYRLVIIVENIALSTPTSASSTIASIWGTGTIAYIKEWIIDPPRLATFNANEDLHVAQEAAAITYNMPS